MNWAAMAGGFVGAIFGVVAVFLGIYWSDRISRARKNRPQEPDHE